MKLKKLFKEVLELQTELDLNIAAYEGAVWFYEDDELTINTQGSKRNLFSGNGLTYSFDVRGATESEDGYVLFYDADNHCGTKDTIIVKASERVEFE